MAPKAADKGKKTADKAKQAAKQKVAEDKTFGLKNKNKSAKVQKFVQTVQKQVTHDPLARKNPAEVKPRDKKKAEEERQKELAALFAVAIKQPKVPPGVDPKSVVCEFFRHGQCTKGFKCKYAHDLAVERKGPKIDLFSDRREGGEDEEGMDDWDEEQLKKAVAEKHGNERGPNKTDIICKFFLDAVEKRQYGWFWKCPNGDDCKYRHALPPGYVLKSQMKELLEEEAKNKKDVTEQIEEERAKVDAKTPMTQEVFLQWRQQKSEEKAKAQAEAEAERRRKGILNGREMFLQEGFTAVDDVGASDDYVREDREGEEAAIQAMVQEAQQRQAAAMALNNAAPGPSSSSAAPAGPSSSAATASSSAAGPSSSAAGPSSSAGVSTTINEADKQLFLEDLDDDDDDDEMEDDDDDLDDGDLDALEQQVKSAHISGGK